MLLHIYVCTDTLTQFKYFARYKGLKNECLISNFKQLNHLCHPWCFIEYCFIISLEKLFSPINFTFKQPSTYVLDHVPTKCFLPNLYYTFHSSSKAVHQMHAWECHNETPLHNYFLLIKKQKKRKQHFKPQQEIQDL